MEFALTVPDCVGELESVPVADPLALPAAESVSEGVPLPVFVNVPLGVKVELAVLVPDVQALGLTLPVLLPVVERVPLRLGVPLPVGVPEVESVSLPVGVRVGEGVELALSMVEGVSVPLRVPLSVPLCVPLTVGVVLGDTVGVRDGVGQEGPPGQGAQVAFPGAAHAPSGQHTAAPASEYRPLAQALQAVARGGLKVPAAHSAGCAVLLASVALQPEPAGQGRGSEPHM